ncbi:MAG: ankyrin repeat domain-containing protein [Desulfovibrio sp.]|nr:ankyrin repeat domain-containing protein [Desulfovibrio sp.]
MLKLLVSICLLVNVLFLATEAKAQIEDAIRDGNLDSVKNYLEKENNVDEMSASELLYLAAQYGKLDIVNYLLSTGADVNARGEDNRSALSVAVQKGHMAIVNTLLERGAEIEDKEGFTTLVDAVESPDTGMVDFLLAKGADINAALCAGDVCTTALHFAASKGNYAMFMHLVEKGANLRQSLPYDTIDGDILNSAVYGGNLDIVKYLISKGFDIHYSEKKLKKSLLASAVNSDSMDVLAVIDYLIGAGLNVNYKDAYNKTVFFAVWTSEDETPAEKNVKSAILQRLIDKGLKITGQDDVGNTPLHHACDLGFVDVVQKLVAKKAPLFVKNAQNETPLDIARKKEDLAVIQVLEKAIAKETDDRK